MKVISIPPRSEGKRQAYEKVVRTNRVNVEMADLVQCLLDRHKDLS